VKPFGLLVDWTKAGLLVVTGNGVVVWTVAGVVVLT